MASLNRVLIMGNLGGDPELRHTTSGQPVTTLRVATTHGYTDRDGNHQESTEWHNVVAWGRTAELCAQYLTKGRAVLVEGRLATRSWEDQSGEKRYATEVVASSVQFLGAPQAAADGARDAPQHEAAQAQVQAQTTATGAVAAGDGGSRPMRRVQPAARPSVRPARAASGAVTAADLPF
jgi:single-strand DNA-binding protein